MLEMIAKKCTTYEHGVETKDWYNASVVTPILAFMYGKIFQLTHSPITSDMGHIHGYIRRGYGGSDPLVRKTPL